MKNFLFAICVFVFVICLLTMSSIGGFAQTITLTSPPHNNNQKCSVTQWMGLVSATITYRSPNVHGTSGADRKGHIWGELVKYGVNDPGFGTSFASPWRAGANEVTTFSLSHDVLINGKEMKAGTYGVFLQVEKDNPWTWIFSRNSTSWGAYYYNQNEDMLRIEATPEESPYTEWLTYGFDNRQLNSCRAFLAWENKRVSFEIEVANGAELYVAQMRAELTSYAGFTAANWVKSARYCLANKINLEEALIWVELSMKSEHFRGQKTFLALQTKAEILLMLNRQKEADEAMEEAINTSPTLLELHQYGLSLLGAGNNARALQIFKLNRERNASDTFMTFLGLARAYTAIGNKKEAIKNWKIAIKNIPNQERANLPEFEAELKKLEG
jgi:tetratricopeptide (TPR) repeat protein